MATIQAKADFDPEEAAKNLREAMKGFGTDEDALIETLTSHNNEQRQEIKTTYQTMYGRVLEEDLDSGTRRDFGDVIMALITPPDLYLARQLKKATKGLGTDEATLIEILLTRTNDEVAHLKEVYEEEFGDSLEDDVRGDTRGAFGRLMMSQLAAGRDETTDVDYDQAEQDAQELYDAGEGQWGTDESVFNSILCLRSKEQLRATFDKYKEISGREMEESIKREMRGDLEDGFLAIVKSIRDLPTYYAERLYKSMKGLGTDEDTLTRVIVSRSEIDLQLVKMRFKEQYDDTVTSFIKGDTRGDYEGVLLAITGDEVEDPEQFE